MATLVWKQGNSDVDCKCKFPQKSHRAGTC